MVGDCPHVIPGAASTHETLKRVRFESRHKLMKPKAAGWLLRALGCGCVWACGLRALAASAEGPYTQIQYLSGTGKDHTVSWEFMVSSGRNAGIATNIPVPSCWETRGFGTYQYGNVSSVSNAETGTYTHVFAVPSHWAGRKIFLVFEGAFTDTTAEINGRQVGPTHQGGFYEFRYDVSTNVVCGASTNALRVVVRRWSTNPSVLKAEEKGDFWTFGGIFRPVYLEAKPASLIERIAVDAQAGGHISVQAWLDGVTNPATLRASVADARGQPLGSSFSASVPRGSDPVLLASTLPAPKPWSAESPNLYTLTVQLLDANNDTLHILTNTIGFRTIAFSNHFGFCLNGKKIVLRGLCTHEEWPTTGRTSSRAQAEVDLALIRDMNFNAIRSTHYPPSKAFLDECDRLGFYVLDELTGWQAAYDNSVAPRLVKELVIRDVNHPCVIAWDNGNEGGWNTTVDHDGLGATNVYAIWDPQQRHVLRPGSNAVFGDVRDPHYPEYAPFLAALGEGKTAFGPTEILHGLYDGGSGASLLEFWDAMRTASNGMGMFLWVFADSGQARADQGGIMDVKGQNGPDGIVGPFREKEGGYFACKAILSPVQIGAPDPATFTGSLPITNRFDFLDLKECTFYWQLGSFPAPTDPAGAFSTNALTGGLRVGLENGPFAGPSVPPQSTGSLSLADLPHAWTNYDALRLSASDSSGNNVCTWTWPLRPARHIHERILGRLPPNSPPVLVHVSDAEIILTNGPRVFSFDRQSGVINRVLVSNRVVSLANGPRPAAGAPWEVANLTQGFSGSNYVILVNDLTNAANGFRWTLRPDGWLQLSYRYTLEGPQYVMGVTFDYPSAKVTAMKWLGQGPYRVYKNRLAGQDIFGHFKSYNDVWTGQSTNYSTTHATATASQWIYPEFAGYHGSLFWATLETSELPITVATPGDHLFLRVFTPPATDQRNVNATYPPGDLSFLDGISPVGDKFHPPTRLGPAGQPNQPAGLYTNQVDFFFDWLPSPDPATHTGSAG